MELSFSDLKSLSELLKPQEESESDDDLPKTGISRLGPGHIGSLKKANVEQTLGLDGDENNKDDGGGKNIWDEREIPDGIRFDESEDLREKPEYEIRYKQAVSAEEVFLQMGQKTPATASCEDIVIEIKLPKETRQDVDLEVLKQVLELRSPKYRLSLPLPHPVDPDLTIAVWETDKLTVTLRMKREFDFVNL